MELKREDYEEPRCLLKMCKTSSDEENVTRISVGRVIQKIDEVLSKNDYNEAERILLYWVSEAQAGRDKRGEFSLRNELMGLYRKLGNEEKAMANAAAALDLSDQLGGDNSEAKATAYVNSATVYKAFGKAAEAIPLFERAKEIYESDPHLIPEKLAGLYNNMALALVDLKRFDEAEELYKKALNTLGTSLDNKPEVAITYLNMASLAEAKLGLEAAEQEIKALIENAWINISDEALPRNGNLAFVCEKCAPIFGYYGYFGYEGILSEKAENIYNS